MLAGQRGDTIIEVLLAITVFSLVSVGAMTIMNQGTNAAQRALEITHVRQQIDAQAEALRALQQSAAAGDTTAWERVTGDSTRHYYADAEKATTCPSENTDIEGSFILNPNTAAPVLNSTWFKNVNASDSLPYSQVRVVGAAIESTGVWIERDFDEGDSLPDLYTFTVNACWKAAGISQPSKLETVVRLYDPGT